jgi:AraC family transcriptional regulator, arabinose operon regulatory protein
MEDYNKVIESLGVRYIKSKNLVLQQPFTVRNFYDVGNNIILLHKGTIAFGDEQQLVEEGEMLFVPGGRSTKVYYGDLESRTISNDAPTGINSLKAIPIWI